MLSAHEALQPQLVVDSSCEALAAVRRPVKGGECERVKS